MKASVRYGDYDAYTAFYALAGQTYYIALSDFSAWPATSCDYMLASPPLSPRLTQTRSMSGVPGSAVSFEIAGELGQSFVIQASTNLVEWQTIHIDTMQSNRMEFIDQSAAEYPARFFRILPLESLFMSTELGLGLPVAAGTAGCAVPVLGPPGQPFVLRVSENLTDWTELGRGWIAGDQIDFPDPDAAEHGVRFYDAVGMP